MREIIGKYTTAKVFTDNIEESAVSTLYKICDSVGYENLPIRIMPDVHNGTDTVVGFSCPIGEMINPSVIGVDVSCTISAHKLSKCLSVDDYALVEHRIKEAVPMGFDINEKVVYDEKKFYAFLNSEYSKARSANPDLVPEIGRIDEKFITNMLKRINLDTATFYKSINSLGGGNHFIEFDEKYSDDEKEQYLLIHCGSRGFGAKVARYWMKIAENSKPDKALVKAKIEQIKSECSDRRLAKELIAQAKEDAKSKNPNGFLSGDNMKMYISDMVICHGYALFNHKTIADKIFGILQKFDGIKCVDSLFTTHNYIDFTSSHPMIRKGSISAEMDERVIIPMNMRDGTLICVGKGNADWNFSAPHGAGRLMSRSAAKKNISLEEYKEAMKDVYSTTVNIGTIDESPMVYKPMQEIIDNISDTVEVIDVIKPIINIKAGGED